MKKTRFSKKLISLLLAVLLAFTGLIPATAAFAADGVEGYYDIELFYKDSDTAVPSTMTNPQGEEVEYIEYMKEGEELNLTYKLIDTEMPDNGYIKWYSETPTLVDVTQEGVVKAFDSSKGAVIHTWIDNEVKTIPLVGSAIASVIEKALFNEYVDVDTMDTEAIIELVDAAFGTDSPLDKWIESYKGELIDSLRYYLDNINSNIHVQLYSSDGTLLDDDKVKINVLKSEEWYSAFLPNGTHITNKSQINTTVAVGSTVQLYAVTTPVRLEYGCIYSVKSSSVFDQGKVVATVSDGGLVTFKNPGTVTVMVSPDTEQVIQNILKLVNYFYSINTEMINSDELAKILIEYVGIDMNRNVLAAILDVCFAISDIVGDTADPVKLTATAVKLISNLVLQFVYNDSITFTVVEAQPLTDFEIEGADTVKEGTQIQLEITNIKPEIGDTSDITWRSSDPSVASVDPKTGIITGRDAGGSLGALSTKSCTIYAVSAANQIEKSFKITVTGKTGKYLSDADINGESYLEMGMETDYLYTVYPQRVAESDNLYISWGIVTGTDEEGNPVYAWADAENPATDGRGSIDSNGHYTVVGGGESTIALKAETGYYLSNGNFYEISSIIKTKTVTNGIPVESIQINVFEAVGIASSLVKNEKITVNGNEYTYATVKAGTQYGGLGAKLGAAVYPENASNPKLTWVIDNSNYKTEIAEDTHSVTVKQNTGHEAADTFNIYAVSQDGTVKSNVITVCVTKNNVKTNQINEESVEVVNGKNADVTHKVDFNSSVDGTYSACYKCNWYSSDDSVFSVKAKDNANRDATITANDVGTATLYCVSADGGIVDTCEVTVVPDKEYLREIVGLCEKTVIRKTEDNAELYKKYFNKLDLAYTVLYDAKMASQTTCDTYADELLYAFYQLGGFVGIAGVNILDESGAQATDKHITVKVGAVSNYTNYSYEFDYRLLPKKAMYRSIKWESSNPNIIVDKNGICRPKSNDPCAGIITVTVTDYMGTEISDRAFIAFARTAAEGITLDTDSIQGGKIGETQKLTATVKPTNVLGNSTASCKDVYWYSSDENIATVSQDGTVSFAEGGNCIIYAVSIDGGYTAQCAVNVVTNYSALQLLIQQYNDLLLNRDNYYPDSWDAYISAMTKAQNMINENASSQAQVDAMYAELENAYNSLQKYNYLQRVELYLDGEQTKEFYQYNVSLLGDGFRYTDAKLNLNVRLYPNNGSYESVVWESSTSDISVTNDGVCSPTVNNPCYGQIRCTVNDHFGNSFTDTVWVSYAYTPVTSLELSETNISGPVGGTYKLNCTVYPKGLPVPPYLGSADIKDYYWESDNEAVAAVDETGLVTFVSAGATKIRAVSYDGGISAECTVSSQGDRSVLLKALEDYKNIDYKAYEYDYSAVFNEAYAAAEAVMNDDACSQYDIDKAAEDLINAYEAMIAHPYISAQSVDISYKTYSKPLVGSEKEKESGTVGDENALSVNLEGSADYENWNNYSRTVLTAGTVPSNAMYKEIGWSVDGSGGADVSVNGTTVEIKPKKTNEGAWAALTATVTDHYDRVAKRTVYVVMSDAVCTSFDIAETDKTVLVTASPFKLNYSISDSAEFKTVLWSSSDENVVKVSSDGTITPVEKGTAVITAQTLDGGLKDTVTINVQVDFNTLASKQAEYYDLIQQVKDGYTYTQESLDALSAVVSEAKTMIDEGRASQAQVNEMIERLDSAYNSLVRYVAVTDVKISADEDANTTVVKDGFIHYIGSIVMGKEIVLKPVFNDENAVYTTLTWTSSNPDVTVDESGILTCGSVSACVTEVTCTATNVFGGTCSSTAYVSFARYAVSGVSFDKDMIFGAPSKTVTLSPTVTNTNNSSLPGAYVAECFYVSNDPEIATVDENGTVTFITQGEAQITAVTKDGGYSASVTAVTTWDTTALKAAIDEADKITYTDYAYDYGTAFAAARESAKAVYENVYASQAEIDAACMTLTESINALQGNEFIVPEISLVQGDTTLKESDIVQVDSSTNQAAVSLVLNDGAMVKSVSLTPKDFENTTASVNGNDVVITKSAEKGSLKLDIVVVDDYDREYTKTYILSVIDTVIPVTAITLTANSQEISDGAFVYSCGGSYSGFKGIQLGFTAVPGNANAITSVTYESEKSAFGSDGNISVDQNGLVTLTTTGKLTSSSTETITVTVTNADGSSVTASVKITINRK